MIRTCNAEHWSGMEKFMPEDAPCGRTYDDVDHSTICPHRELPGGIGPVVAQTICQAEHPAGGMGTRVRVRTR